VIAAKKRLKPVLGRILYLWKSRPRSSAVRQFRHNGHGVLITSIPKSGTHLLEQLIQVIGLTLPYERQGVLQFYGWQPQENKRVQDDLEYVTRMIGSIKPGRYLEAHLIPDPRIIEAAERAGVRVIFIYRDPRAVVWSHVNHVFRFKGSKFHEFYTTRMPSREACIDLVIRGAQSYPVEFPEYWLPDIRSSYSKFLGWRDQPSCLSVKFEELIGDQGGGSTERQLQTVEHILDYIGFPYDQAALHRYSTQVYSQKTQTFFQGKTDAWRDAFTAENIQTFNRVAGDLLQTLGYEV
jgi:hypothetical protein